MGRPGAGGGAASARPGASASAPPRRPRPRAQAGHNLARMQSVSEIYSAGNVAVLACAGLLALAPVLLRARRGERGARPPAASLLPIIIEHTRESVASAAAAAHKAMGLPPALSPPRDKVQHEL